MSICFYLLEEFEFKFIFKLKRPPVKIAPPLVSDSDSLAQDGREPQTRQGNAEALLTTYRRESADFASKSIEVYLHFFNLQALFRSLENVR